MCSKVVILVVVLIAIADCHLRQSNNSGSGVGNGRDSSSEEFRTNGRGRDSSEEDRRHSPRLPCFLDFASDATKRSYKFIVNNRSLTQGQKSTQIEALIGNESAGVKTAFGNYKNFMSKKDAEYQAKLIAASNNLTPAAKAVFDRIILVVNNKDLTEAQIERQTYDILNRTTRSIRRELDYVLPNGYCERFGGRKEDPCKDNGPNNSTTTLLPPLGSTTTISGTTTVIGGSTTTVVGAITTTTLPPPIFVFD
uniref:DUF148 domain-containing protein n=1 Tax=Rhabditophanes sp. KR3021 TaxID=114890 RepID=A0AC35UCA5_9BILA